MKDSMIIKWIIMFGDRILNTKWVRKASFQKEFDERVKTIFSELYGESDARVKLQEFKSKCVGLIVTIVFVGSLVVALSGLGLVEEFYVLLFAIACGGVGFFDLKKKITERRFQIKKSLPDFISRLVLLVEAGMTLNRAFAVAARSIEKTSPLYAEIARTCNEIENGVLETQAYEQMAVRCRVIEVARFSSMLIQNLRKGSSELAALLRLVASECWSARKAHARKRGEEAAAKMLIPVSLLLIAVLIVTAGPALASLMDINTFQSGG
ncbi:MAG: type II secretion system F family protein [Bacillota bacterium]